MNDIQNLIDRQLGFHFQLNYDNILKRLVVDFDESFYGLQSANEAASFDQDPPIFACRFSEAPGYEHILALANEDGRVAIQNTTNVKTASTLEGFQCHNNAVFDLAWMPGHMSFVTVSGDHTASLWDVGEGAPRRVLVFANHTRSVKTAVFRPGEPGVFATGARDGHILVWDIRAAALPALVLKPDNCLFDCHSCFTPRTPASAAASHGKRPRLDAHRAISITGLAFQDDATLISCGECDGNIKVWDLRRNYGTHRREPLPKHAIPYCGASTRNGYTNLLVDESRTRLYASCMDNVIYCFNIAAYNTPPERRYTGHENGTFYIKTSLSPDGAYLVSGSSDKHAYVWNVRGGDGSPVVRLAGHRAEVTCAAWSRAAAREPRLVTCSDDARHMIWRVGLAACPDPGRPPRGAASPAPRPAPAPRARWGPATPAAHRRRAPATPAATPPAAKRARVNRPPTATKRCLAACMDAAAASPPPAAKRPRDEPLLSAGVKRPAAWPPADEDGLAPLSPPPCPASPERAGPGEGRVLAWGTPTKDLPDFVLRGEAPHLRLMSPAKKKRDAPNWLTLIVREKRGKAPAEGERPPSPREGAPPRRASTPERAPRPTKKTGTLLKYFSVARREK